MISHIVELIKQEQSHQRVFIERCKIVYLHGTNILNTENNDAYDWFYEIIESEYERLKEESGVKTVFYGSMFSGSITNRNNILQGDRIFKIMEGIFFEFGILEGDDLKLKPHFDRARESLKKE